MNTASGFGLILLAASIAAIGSAVASGPEAAAGQSYFFAAAPAARSPQGYLGVDVRDVPADQVAALKLKQARGAEIILVDHDAPAGKANLHEHDVILQMNGQAIDGQDQLRRMLHETPPGRAVQLVISREGQSLTITTQMSTKDEVERQAWAQHLTVPEPQEPENADTGYIAAPSSSPAPRSGNSFIGSLLMSSSYTGAMLEKMSPQLADFFGAAKGAGLLVRSVVENSPAALAGMHAGDVVLRANAKLVNSTGDWARAIKDSKGHPVSITVLRDKKEQTLTLTPDSKKRSEVDQPQEAPAGYTVARLGFSLLPRS